MTHKPKLKVEMPVICLTCASLHQQYVKADENGFCAVDFVKCEKCQNKAYVQHPLRHRFLLGAMAKEIATLRLDVMSLQEEVCGDNGDR